MSCVDEMGVDEMGVDEMGGNQLNVEMHLPNSTKFPRVYFFSKLQGLKISLK